MLVAFPVVIFLTFLWVQLGVIINKENDWMAELGYAFAICAELFEILWPATLRLVSKQIVQFIFSKVECMSLCYYCYIYCADILNMIVFLFSISAKMILLMMRY